MKRYTCVTKLNPDTGRNISTIQYGYDYSCRSTLYDEDDSDRLDRLEIKNDNGDWYWLPAEMFEEAESDEYHGEKIGECLADLERQRKELDAKIKKLKEMPKSRNVVELALNNLKRGEDRAAKERKIDDAGSKLCELLGMDRITTFNVYDLNKYAGKGLYLGHGDYDFKIVKDGDYSVLIIKQNHER